MSMKRQDLPNIQPPSQDSLESVYALKHWRNKMIWNITTWICMPIKYGRRWPLIGWHITSHLIKFYFIAGLIHSSCLMYDVVVGFHHFESETSRKNVSSFLMSTKEQIMIIIIKCNRRVCICNAMPSKQRQTPQTIASINDYLASGALCYTYIKWNMRYWYDLKRLNACFVFVRMNVSYLFTIFMCVRVYRERYYNHVHAEQWNCMTMLEWALSAHRTHTHMHRPSTIEMVYGKFLRDPLNLFWMRRIDDNDFLMVYDTLHMFYVRLHQVI